jgi:hypothetical protein
MAAKTGVVQLSQRVAQGALAAPAGICCPGCGFTTGYFRPDTVAPTDEPSDILALVCKMSGPHLLCIAEERVAEEGRKGVLTQLA